MNVNKFKKDFSVSYERVIEFLQIPLDSCDRLYRLGFTLCIASLLLKNIPNFSTSLFVCGLMLLCVGFLFYLYDRFKYLWLRSELGGIYKLLIGAFLSSLIALPSHWMATHAINDLTGLPPENFPYSVSILSLLYSPYMIAVAGIITLSLYLILLVLSGTWLIYFYHIRDAILSSLLPTWNSEQSKLSKIKILSLSGHAISAILLVFILTMVPELYETKKDRLKGIIAFIAQVDYYGQNRCINVKHGEPVAFLKDGTISVLIRNPLTGNLTFEHRSCEQTLG